MNEKKPTADSTEQAQLRLFDETACDGSAHVQNALTVEDIVAQGLAHLNGRTERTGPAKFTSPRPMKARVEDGATLEDVCLVIDYCHAMWWGDLRMEQYIRPKTLFGKENFPDYLVRARKWTNEGRPPIKQGNQSAVERFGHSREPGYYTDPAEGRFT